ncbi:MULTISPECIES: acyl dehydratase [unclassified Rhodococcus (in: high G+C Gram-positive bacteria)]|uniref:acyl dehydratase n=1 Tax=unclassified Rhodococcus (in: high G+C Gram-positive bacteria) TaxID=192944 RepID=UPI001FB27346|nr:MULTISPECIES: acyl dehydratase [unclassified Rhodococcus (in: high G+C Gram-positive bacteria)]MCJ0906891.1 acyl dehydratase [Rhodococcus sp. ARC_M6]MDI9916283.1 acyl dehydratase [Rhodococcus sp. IEGM 1379]
MSFLDCVVGTGLPALELPLDRTLIVAAAISSQDFEDVHHDPGKAQERGTPDVFMSINSTNGFIDRYVTDWSGPASRIVKTALRLGVPNFAGDTMTFTGEVVENDGSTVTVAVQGRNERGTHVTATVTVTSVEGATA